MSSGRECLLNHIIPTLMNEMNSIEVFLTCISIRDILRKFLAVLLQYIQYTTLLSLVENLLKFLLSKFNASLFSLYYLFILATLS
jgi:hypothetical protein